MDIEKLAKILCKLQEAPVQDISLDTVWESAGPEVRNYYRDRAVLINYMLHEEGV